MPIIEIGNLDFAYKGETVLQNVNLSVGQGDFLAIIGPNGGGKTTLLKLILGLLKPNRGTIGVNGKSPEKASSCIGYVPQDIHINRNFPITAIDVVLMGIINTKIRLSRQSGKNRGKALAALKLMEMADHADRKIGNLSGGERQRVFIARALATNPKILLLDEPTSGIDPKGQTDFYRLLGELDKDITILVVSHDFLAISKYVKSIACVNKELHYHDQAEITRDMMETMYPCSSKDTCPVELIAHGMPHRVLMEHIKR